MTGPKRRIALWLRSFIVALAFGGLIGFFVITSPAHSPATSVSTSLPPAPVTTTTVGTRTVTISAVGDTELGNTPQLPSDPAAYLESLKPLLAAPIVFGNLEGTMTIATTSKCPANQIYCYAFKVPPSYAKLYRAAGFTVLNSANNHAYDFGAAGVAATTAALTSAGIVQAGLPGEIGITHDGPVKVAFVDFAPYYNTNNLLDVSAATALIARAKQLASVVVVYMHAGAEGPLADHVTRSTETFVGENRGNPYVFAHAAIDAGADLVIASGPHVLRGLEWYKGHLIDYSLGDFVNYYNFATVSNLRMSAILHVTLTSTGLFVSGHFTSLLLQPSGEAVVDPTAAAASFVNQLSVQDFASSAAEIGQNGRIVPPSLH